nr:hypothetical protein [Tanacetum cinerariifolium]
RVDELATQHEGTAIVPAALLDEVTALVEWPVPLVCSFEERFLEVPQEALITTMQDNQKYFCLLDADGKLLPRFITVANIESKDPSQIVLGNEKVVRPRLTDAEFFFKQDKKQKLETFNQRLQNVVFQAQLGTLFDKAERVSKLAAFIAPRIGGDAQRAGRAGLLSKCDLATEMVGEFPEMQGVAGYYYALADGEPEDVALALNEQYMPPLGILRILIEKKLDLDLIKTVQFAVTQFGAKVKSAGLAEQVLDFIFDRLRARYEDEGVDVSVYLSVRALQPGSALDFDQRVQAVQAFRKLPEAAALAAVNKRADQAVAPMSANRQYNEALTRLAALREPVDAFFEAVMVNAEDANVRANRYALLARLRNLFLGVADISLLG